MRYFSVQTRVLGGLPVLLNIAYDGRGEWEIESVQHPDTGKNFDFVLRNPRFDIYDVADEIEDEAHEHMIAEAEHRYDCAMGR